VKKTMIFGRGGVTTVMIMSMQAKRSVTIAVTEEWKSGVSTRTGFMNHEKLMRSFAMRNDS
jgi:hypothetical protein